MKADIYPVGLFSDIRDARLFGWHRLRFWYLRRQIRAREWRAVRNYFNGYLAEHDGCPHNAGRGWTKAAAHRRVMRLHRESHR